MGWWSKLVAIFTPKPGGVVPAQEQKPAAQPKPDPAPVQEQPKSAYELLAPWVFVGMTMLGWTEFDHDKALAAFCWQATKDCRGLKSVIGTAFAWCSGFWCGVMQKLKLPHTWSGGASSWRGYGEGCDYIFGAFLPIRHVSKKNHICVFLWWIDEKKRIAACFGGNQNNCVCIAEYNLSGNAAGHEEVMTGPRWPKGMPKTDGPYQPPGWQVGTKLGASTR